MKKAQTVNLDKANKVGLRMWIIVILIGLAGQFAWSIENMYLNTYIAYLNFNAPVSEKFDYNLLISITTALSAVTATLTTIFMGGLSDKLRKRKIFISFGYILWGISTASFGLLNVYGAVEIIPISMSAITAAIMVIVIDCIMTFFGSTGNDAAFNSYITKNIEDKNRAKVEGVLGILPLIAMLIIFVGLNGLTTEANGNRWDLFFYIVGGIVFVVGIISLFLLPKEKKDERNEQKYFSLILEGFKPATIKKNKLLYIILIAYFIFNVSVQIYFPYLMIYVERTCEISNLGDSFLTPFAIVMAISLLFGSVLSVFIGFRADKKGKTKMLIPTLLITALGLFMMFFAPYIENDIAKIIYASISGLIMILGYVSFPAILNSLIRSYIPKGNEGIFMGIRMIFVVALPMCIGPFIGSALNNAYGEIYYDQFNFPNALPSNYGYLVALGVLALVLIPLYFVFKYTKKFPKNNGHLVNDLLKKQDKEIRDVNQVSFKEYPRPNLVRDSFINLNGLWDLKIVKKGEDKDFDKKVNVPFAVESPFSNINHLLEVDEMLVYRRFLKIDDFDKNKNYILHLDGVDQTFDLFINGNFVTYHDSGYTKTSVNITSFLKEENEIIVKVHDFTDFLYYSRGKQVLNPQTCFYSSSSGIYKNVWMEVVEKDYIRGVKFKIHYDLNQVGVIVMTNNTRFEQATIFLDGKAYNLETNKENLITLENPISWSYKNPYLYNVEIRYKKDVVKSYFGFRKIEIKEENGSSKVFLNNKEVILNGLLDQGYYYPNSLTPSSYADYEKDILNLKGLGFNTIRKHIKVEMDYFYYLCDKHGMLVIQDIPNGGYKYKFFNTAFPRFNIKLFNKLNLMNEEKLGRKNEKSKKMYLWELQEILTELYNYPSIICYTLFNEGWGEFDPDAVYDLAKECDDSRIYDSTSGWYINNKRDLYSIHAYIFQTRVRKDKKQNKPYILSECGGRGLKVKGHSLYKGFFSHSVSFTSANLTIHYEKLYKKFIELIDKGVLKGVIYTQLADCETEYNGLYTFDRKVLKVNPEIIKKYNYLIEKYND